MTHSPLDVAGVRSRVQSALAGFLARQRTRLAEIDEASLLPVADAIEAFVLAGGKRLRPAFAYWGYRGAGGPDSDAVIAAAASLEFVQASALMHDDVMDGSETRRGEPAVHRRFAALHARSGWLGTSDDFGTCAAILLGDLCLVWSDEMLCGSGVPIDVLARARGVFDEMRTQVTVGQYLDVHTQATGDSSTERASLVARYKSAKYTIEQPLLFGAAIAGAPAGLGKVYSAYGMPLGEAFQLRDDVLGVFGDPAVTGKPAGDDLREGKRTYLIAATLETTDTARQRLVARLLGDPQLDEAGVAALREVITLSGALERTERRIDALTATALEAVDDPDVEPEAAAVLRSLAELAAHRHG